MFEREIVAAMRAARKKAKVRWIFGPKRICAWRWVETGLTSKVFANQELALADARRVFDELGLEMEVEGE